MANNSISLVNLDFDTLKANLKTYLKNQSQFSDYDFDGSNMSVLLDILTYNTHLNAFYMNMVVSEMFMDSAQLRNSVISKAKELNYVPRSAKSSEAYINIQFPQSNLDIFEIPSGAKFTGKTGNGTFTFTTDQSHILYPSGNYFTANINIQEGIFTTDTFVVDDSTTAQRFIMSNDNVDTDSLTVIVSENVGQTNTTFIRADSLYGLTSNSSTYFLQATEDTRYEIVFGDGVFGRKPLNNALVFATYRIASGSTADGSTNFTLDDNLGTYNGLGSSINSYITVLSSATGGANAEGIESIRYNAPRHYQTQNRAITVGDYKSIILQNFTNVKALNVFGGQNISSSVQYGKVFISPITQTGAPLSNNDKRTIEAFIKDRCTVGITPQVVDPDYLYLVLTVLVKFDANVTSNSPFDIKNIVNAAIQDFDENSLTDFDIEFKLSRLEAQINDSDPSISSNETKVIMRKDVNPDLNTDSYISVEYRNPIVPGSFYSTTFLSASTPYQYTDYNPNNNTFSITQVENGMVKITNSTNVVYLKNLSTPGYEFYTEAGTIDYVTGEVDLNKISINGFVDSSSIRFYAQPENQDIAAKNNDLIQVDLQNLDITVVAI